ncbi:MAG TPA: hypothetical protein VG759_05050 [Candidatus Angelobacter sp.]|jgi:hypothetical protein|nr:hypothetical protein [Candidatus Angelobacter sp.]
MLLRRFFLALSMLVLIVLAGCGGGGVQLASRPMGPFSPSSLSGMYAVSLTGVNSFGFFAFAASFQADGNGHIVSGVEDVNSGSGVFTNVALNGTYTLGPDGRGVANINSGVANITLDFVMLSTKRALVVRFNNNATASGSLDLQDSSAFSNAAVQGAFAFNLSGIDVGGHAFSTVGNIAPDGAGNITSGVQDLNDSGTIATNQALTGSYNVAGSANGRGSVTLTTSVGTLTFAAYVVNANQLKLIELDNTPVLAGDVFRQQGPFSNATLSGPSAFTLGGANSVGAPLVVGGVMSADGAGNITSGAEDINNNGAVSQNLALTGTYAIAANGRGTLTLNSSAGTLQLALYPSMGGQMLLEIDNGATSSGAAFAQQGAPFSSGSVQGTYGLNLTGANGGTEIDSIAQFSADGAGNLTGALDLNNNGALSNGLALNSSYTVAANGRGTAALKSSAGTQNIIFYVVNNSRVLLIETDANPVSVGEFEHQ